MKGLPQQHNNRSTYIPTLLLKSLCGSADTHNLSSSSSFLTYLFTEQEIIKMVRADYYLYIYENFITDRFDKLFVKYCYKYNINGKKQLNYRDAVLSDIALTFCYKCKHSFDIPKNVVFPCYLVCALRNQVKYSILRQLKYVRNKQKDAVYFIQKFGKTLYSGNGISCPCSLGGFSLSGSTALAFAE